MFGDDFWDDTYLRCEILEDDGVGDLLNSKVGANTFYAFDGLGDARSSGLG